MVLAEVSLCGGPSVILMSVVLVLCVVGWCGRVISWRLD